MVEREWLVLLRAAQRLVDKHGLPCLSTRPSMYD